MYNLESFSHTSQLLGVIFLYAGPDQILPLMSLIGGIIGVLLVFWQRFVGFLRRAAQFFLMRLRRTSKKKA